MKKIDCKTKISLAERIRVRIVRPPLVDTTELRRLLAARARALVL